MSTPKPVVPCSKKLSFDTRKQANAAALTALHQRNVKLKSYHCQYCELWHLATKYEY